MSRGNPFDQIVTSILKRHCNIIISADIRCTHFQVWVLGYSGQSKQPLASRAVSERAREQRERRQEKKDYDTAIAFVCAKGDDVHCEDSVLRCDSAGPKL